MIPKNENIRAIVLKIQNVIKLHNLDSGSSNIETKLSDYDLFLKGFDVQEIYIKLKNFLYSIGPLLLDIY